MAMERFESASSEHGIPIDEARRLVRTSVDRWNEEVLREFAHPEPSPARVRSLKGVLNSLGHLFAPLFSSLEDARKMFEPANQDIHPCVVGTRWAILFPTARNIAQSTGLPNWVTRVGGTGRMGMNPQGQ